MIPRIGPVWSAMTALAIVPIAFAQAAVPSAQGIWYDEPKQAAIQITPCGKALCGRVVWLQQPKTETGTLVLDEKNSNPADRLRPICGLQLMSGFQPGDKLGSWDGGLIYNPDDGATYKSNMHLTAQGALSVRGYVGISLFGKSEVWTQAPTGLPSCRGGIDK